MISRSCPPTARPPRNPTRQPCLLCLLCFLQWCASRRMGKGRVWYSPERHRSRGGMQRRSRYESTTVTFLATFLLASSWTYFPAWTCHEHEVVAAMWQSTQCPYKAVVAARILESYFPHVTCLDVAGTVWLFEGGVGALLGSSRGRVVPVFLLSRD